MVLSWMKAFGFDFDLVHVVIFIVKFLTPELASQLPKEDLENNNKKKKNKETFGTEVN